MIEEGRLPFWLRPEAVAPILAQVRDAGYGEVTTLAESDEVMIVSAVGAKSGEKHVVRCKALRDWADVLGALDKQQRKVLLRGRAPQKHGDGV